METTAVARWSNVRPSYTKHKAMSTEQPKTMWCLPRKIVDGQRITPALRNVQKALALYESQRLQAVNPDLRATYLANRAEAAELLGELYMMLWDRSGSAREKERLANAALLAVETGRQRALEDFHSLADTTVRKQRARWLRWTHSCQQSDIAWPLFWSSRTRQST